MISIATKLRPFIHRVGAQCMIPGTTQVLEAFPDVLCIGSLKIPLGNHRFSREFTLQMDLERDCVWVFGKGFRCKIFARPDGFVMAKRGETKFFPADIGFHLPDEMERLSLGSHQAQDWELVARRFDLKEVFPILYYLGQKVPPSSQEMEGSADLEEWVRSSFHHMAVPRQPALLHSAFERIRSLFMLEKENHIQLLANNPFPEGRLLNLQTQFGSFDLEWTKRKLRRATLHVRKTGEIHLDLPRGISSFRFKQRLHDRGERHFVVNPLRIEAGTVIFLDQFHENLDC